MSWRRKGTFFDQTISRPPVLMYFQLRKATDVQDDLFLKFTYLSSFCYNKKTWVEHI